MEGLSLRSVRICTSTKTRSANNPTWAKSIHSTCDLPSPNMCHTYFIWLDVFWVWFCWRADTLHNRKPKQTPVQHQSQTHSSFISTQWRNPLKELFANNDLLLTFLFPSPCGTFYFNHLTMPQCLSPPDFKSKSPAIAELLANSSKIFKNKLIDKVSMTELDTNLKVDLVGKLDFDPGCLLSVSDKSFVNCDYYRRSEVDDFVYLEFFVDTIKPEYSALNPSSTTFSSCFTNFKLSNGIIQVIFSFFPSCFVCLFVVNENLVRENCVSSVMMAHS